MIKKDLRRMVLPIALLLCIAIAPMLGRQEVAAANPGPFFSLSVLGPNTNPNRNQWSTLMVEQFPKIGIEVDVFDHTGWGQIYARTWDYPGPFPIPSYAEGGYDILFVGWSGSLDWDPTGLFDAASWPPNGDNHYQWTDAEFETLLTQYTQSFLTSERVELGKQMQKILYDAVFAVTLIYPRSLYPVGENIAGVDWLLWASAYMPFDLVSNGGDEELHYACPADFVDFVPLLMDSVYDYQWGNQIWDPLIYREKDTREWTGRIASNYDSADGITWTVDLDSDATWADGNPVTPEDVIFTYQAALTPALGSGDYSYLAKYFDNSSITKVDADTVQFVLKEPYAFAEGLLSWNLLPKHIWDPAVGGPEYVDWGTQAVTWATSEPAKMFGAGPYMLDNYDPTNAIIHVTKNPYFGDLAAWDEPIIDDIYFEFYSNKEGALSALAAGDVDIVDAQFAPLISEVEDIPGTYYELVSDPGSQEFGFNMMHPYAGTGESCPIAGAASANHIRMACSYLVPRDIIVEEICEGLAAPGVTPFPDCSVGFDDTLVPIPYDLEEAREHMRLAGFDIAEPTTEQTGAGLVVIMSILALAGASQVFLLKRRK